MTGKVNLNWHKLESLIRLEIISVDLQKFFKFPSDVHPVCLQLYLGCVCPLGVSGEPAGHAGGRIQRPSDLRGEEQEQAAQVEHVITE